MIQIILFITFIILSNSSDFLTEQKKFERVREAVKEKHQYLENKFKVNQITTGELNILIVAYKEDDLLEIWGKNRNESSYRKILTYEICSRSGEPGPKRKQGDYQVPEGFYHIERFNPTSKFYLSLGLNYPNLSDRRKSKYSNLGGDIFIHGRCVTIGCLPMTDNFIKEIYLLAVHAKNNGQSRIPVYIFPFKMTDKNMTVYKERFKGNKDLIDFWENIKTGYDLFIETKQELEITVADNGDYNF